MRGSYSTIYGCGRTLSAKASAGRRVSMSFGWHASTVRATCGSSLIHPPRASTRRWGSLTRANGSRLVCPAARCSLSTAWSCLSPNGEELHGSGRSKSIRLWNAYGRTQEPCAFKDFRGAIRWGFWNAGKRFQGERRDNPHGRLVGLLPQLLEQRLRLDEVACVEALSEPGVQRCEKSASLGGAAVPTEPAAEACGDAQLVRLRTLPVCHRERVPERRLDLGRVGAPEREQLATAAESVRTPDVLAGHGTLGLRQRGERVSYLSRPRVRVREKAEVVFEEKARLRRHHAAEALAHRGDSFIRLPFLGQRPTADHHGLGHQAGLLAAFRYSPRSMFERSRGFPK